MNKSSIDYLAQAHTIGRPGYTLNIITGCEHWHIPEICKCGTDCYAYELVVNKRLKNHPSYPYGFSPTFHPERVRTIGGRPKLIFLNDMGDVGGDWIWKSVAGFPFTPTEIALTMRDFATLNPRHIILLLTKRPEWYELVWWPGNVWCGFTATNNEELTTRVFQSGAAGGGVHKWISLEPWLDDKPPHIQGTYFNDIWLVIGGLSGPNARPVSVATHKWLLDKSIQAKRFTKSNAYRRDIYDGRSAYPREYPDAWRVYTCPTCGATGRDDLLGCVICGGVLCDVCGSPPEGICGVCEKKLMEADKNGKQ